MYGYIYKTTNLINGKIYIGQHCSNKFDTSYYGSGKKILRALKKYGLNNFNCEIIEWCETREIANEREIFWICKLNSKNNDIGYNITDGGEGWKGGKHSDETKNKISRTKTGVSPNRVYKVSDETKQKISNTLKSKNSTAWNKGIPMRESTKEKLRLANLGKKQSEETIAKLKGRQAWNKGSHLSDEEKENLRIKNLGKKYSEETKQKHRNHWLGENNPNYGGLKESTKEKLRLANLGKIWVSNDSVSKQIKPEELEYYLIQGFHKGRKKF